jgi:CBS domain-containing protein
MTDDGSSTILVKDIMSSDIISVNSSTSIKDAIKKMDDAKVGSVIVMEKNILLGIITDRDFAIKIAAHSCSLDTPVKDIMPTAVFTIGPNDTIWQAADLMHIRNIKKIPVVDKDKVVGVITATDLVNNFAIATENGVKKTFDQTLSRVFSK